MSAYFFITLFPPPYRLLLSTLSLLSTNVSIDECLSLICLSVCLSGGHTCPDPDEMLQMDGCNSHGCHGYSWLTWPWQPCNASCESGEGVQTREVVCVQDNQNRVNDSK